MYCFIMQPWVTIRGNSTIGSITQSEPLWLDLAGFQDVVCWLEAKEILTGGATNIAINYETAPNKENVDFIALNGATPVNLTTVGPVVSIYLKDTASNPLARWLRWTLLPSGGTVSTTWDATFRVLVAANAPGRRRADLLARQTGDLRSASSVPLHLSEPRAASAHSQYASLGQRPLPQTSGLSASGSLRLTPTIVQSFVPQPPPPKPIR
jgi:hypothetical protein